MLTIADIIDPKIQKHLEVIRKRYEQSVSFPDSTTPCRRRQAEVIVFSGSIQHLNQLMADIAYLLEVIKRLKALAKTDTKG